MRRVPAGEAATVRVGLVLVLTWVFLGATTSFLSVDNLDNIAQGAAPVAIVGIGMTMVIITGGIDVSVGSSYAICSVVVAKMVLAGNPIQLTVVVALAIGTACGLFNAVLISYGRIPPIIATFGTLNLFRFISFLIFSNRQVSNVPPSLHVLGLGLTLSVPNCFWLALVLVMLAAIYLRSRPSARSLFAIGGNREAARLAGIPAACREGGAYILTGLFVGVASLIFVGGNGFFQASVQTGWELQVIAAVVIGGTSILG